MYLICGHVVWLRTIDLKACCLLGGYVMCISALALELVGIDFK